jgi:hypothetical protein
MMPAAITLNRIKTYRIIGFSWAVDARDCIVTISGIKRADIVKAPADIRKARHTIGTLTDNIVFSASTSNFVVARKSISEASIDYFLHPKEGDNISLLSKR